MADNYLERKRDEYEAKKAEWIRRKKLHLDKQTKIVKDKEI